MSVPKEELEKLLNHLNDKNKQVAKSFLSWLIEQQMDEEDDELNTDDLKAIEKARKELANGEAYSLEDIKREFEI